MAKKTMKVVHKCLKFGDTLTSKKMMYWKMRRLTFNFPPNAPRHAFL